MLRVHENIYCALYPFTLKRWNGDEYLASFMTTCALGGALGLHVVLLMGIIVSLEGPGALDFLAPKIVFLTVVLLITLGGYAAFVRNDRYRQLTVKFDSIPTQ